jgi:4-diphosphocytidyl-2-C-methyl-D-erythritol kinase
MPSGTANAKINLFLHVLARESSGYHGIETLFCRIALADDIIVESGEPGIHLEVDGHVPGELEHNLAYRAADVFHGRLGRTPAVRIGLVKRIPVGAGLGGGSSDAATTLHALNKLYGQPFGAPELIEIGARLGSDVAFFMSGAAQALAWGRGDRMLELEPLPERPILVAWPTTPMATAEAYELLARAREGTAPPGARVIGARSLSTWEAVARFAANDFEDSVFGRIDGLVAVRDAIRRGGADIALLSGSGSAIFGVFDDVRRRAATAAVLRYRFPDLRVVETVTIGDRGVDRAADWL